MLDRLRDSGGIRPHERSGRAERRARDSQQRAAVTVRWWCVALIGLTLATGAEAQTSPSATTAPAAPTSAEDALGRGTPRGTLLGFLSAARKGDFDLARHYLDTTQTGRSAERLARQLFVVLDARLPARLTQVSDDAEGSRANPLTPDEDRVGAIEGPDGPIPIFVRRVRPPTGEPIWLFTGSTLAAVPAVYSEVVETSQGRLPQFLIDRRIGHVRLAEWLVILIGLPLFYFATVLLNRALTPAFARLTRRRAPRMDGWIRNAIPTPARMLLVSIAAHQLFSALPLSLLIRQVLTNSTAVVAIIALTWLTILLNAGVERYASRRLLPTRGASALSLLRVGRRVLDALIVLGGALGVLRHFGVDPTPLLAGLGVGGIAVALAAQKTLENVIAGASLILDRAVQVGDFLKIGAVEGTVDHIGLRSTRIRTPGRSIVSVPNSQIANMSLETLSARDKFWFHPIVALRQETTSGQMQIVLDGIRQALERQTTVEPESIRVRFHRLGAFSLDVEVYAYVLAADWTHFMAIQERLLIEITSIVERAGTAIASPPQVAVGS
jgi:MscS family membrane protein